VTKDLRVSYKTRGEITRSGHESFGESPRLHFVQNDILRTARDCHAEPVEASSLSALETYAKVFLFTGGEIETFFNYRIFALPI
jgi:hypothetical protein